MGCNCKKNKEEFAKRLEAAKTATGAPVGQQLSSNSPEALANPTLQRYLLRAERIQRRQKRAERIKLRELRAQRRKEEAERLAQISEKAVLDKRMTVQQKQEEKAKILQQVESPQSSESSQSST